MKEFNSIAWHEDHRSFFSNMFKSKKCSIQKFKNEGIQFDRGKSGKKARDAIQKSVHTEDPSEVEASSGASSGGQKLTDEDRDKIKEAIRNAKSLSEVNYLQTILASGKIPEKGWNRQMDLNSVEEAMMEA
ncbi:hypothetical protein B9Z55_004412 [Caenorhabditis nigoni]|uniref:Uncharacterized protein n=1 Tax=Caenorhabditis nigoni TaxID=1611254 RepID=A0A2G5UX55_9PELO|nr:hypothetical protein B9Z55_004412 [Caenorhabditis nigoni]